jgi:phosphoribosylformylglycinamidine synthase
MEGSLGAVVRLDADDVALFGEAPGAVLIAGPREVVEAVPGTRVIGEVGGDTLELEGVLSVPVADLRAAYEGAIPAMFA